MKKVVLAGALATAGLVAATAAIAAAPSSAPGAKILRIDTNKDGIVTVAELEQAASARFHKLDTNGDGKLIRTELEAPRAKWLASHPQAAADPKRKGRSRGDRFARLDANGDGAVTFAEFS